MPGSNETTAKFSIDISDLKKGIAEANRQIKLANAEFKAASASMDKWSDSTAGLTAKIEQTEKVLSANKKKLEAYKAEMEAVTKEYGENSKEAENARIKYENQRAVVIKTQKSLGDYKEALVKLEDEQKAAAEAAKLQDNAYNSLNRVIKSQKDDLSALKAQYANVVVEQGKDSDSAKDLAKQIDTLSNELKQNQISLREADEAAEELDKSLKDTGSTTVEVSNGFTVLKGALADLVSAGIQKAATALVDLGKAAYQAYEEYDAGADSIIAATGATGEAAEGLMEVYKNVSKNVVASYDEIGTAVGEVNTRFGAEGQELDDLSTKFLKFSKLNNTDTKSSIDSVQAAMAAWGISAKDTGLVLDTLNKAGQDTGVSVNQLSDSLVNNAPALQEMGYSVSDAAMFLANLDKSGVDASATMAGLKKALNNASKEGKPMSEALAEMEDSIKNASSSTEAITKATELFGSKAGAAIATAVRDGRLSFDDLGTSMKDFEGNVNTTFENTLDGPDKLAQVIQDVKTEFATAVDDFMTKYEPEITEFTDDLINNVIPDIEEGLGWLLQNIPLISGVVGTLTAAFVAFKTAAAIGSIIDLWKKYELTTKLAAAGQWLLNAAMSANPVGLIIAGVAALVAAFVYLWNKSEAFREFWMTLWEILQIAVEAAVLTIKSTFEPLVNFFMAIWDQIKEPAMLLFALLVAQFQQTITTIVTVAQTLITVFTKVWAGIKKIFAPVKSYFVTIFTGAVEASTKILNGLVGTVKKIINTIIKAINTFINGLNGITIPDWVPGVGGGQLHIPNIPELAKGGVLSKGQMALLEGSGAEAVIPLDKNKRWINATANALKVALEGQGLINQGTNQVINNTYEFTQNNTSPKALDPLTVYRNTNSLLFAAQARLS